MAPSRFRDEKNKVLYVEHGRRETRSLKFEVQSPQSRDRNLRFKVGWNRKVSEKCVLHSSAYRMPSPVRRLKIKLYKWNTVHNGVTPLRQAVLDSPRADDCTWSKWDSKPLSLRGILSSLRAWEFVIFFYACILNFQQRSPPSFMSAAAPGRYFAAPRYV